MPTPKRQRIIEAFRDRLQAITVPNGFATDAGQHLSIGEVRQFGEDDPDLAIALVIDEDDYFYQNGLKFGVRLPLAIHALAKANLDEPHLAVETVLGDIKRAIELDDRSLGGLVDQRFERGPTRPFEREEGSTAVGVIVPYVVPYYESWGAP